MVEIGAFRVLMRTRKRKECQRKRKEKKKKTRKNGKDWKRK